MNSQYTTEKARNFQGIAYVFAKPVLLLHYYSIIDLKLQPDNIS